MKFNLKAIAVAAAMVAVSAAHAELTPASNGNSSFALLAFNTVTKSYYVRDLGTTLNAFLPNSVTTASGDGAVTGNRTPEAGLNLSWGDTSGTFATWFSAQTASDVRWTVAAGDGQGTAGSTNVQRALVAFSQTPGIVPSNSTVRGAIGSSNGVSGLAFQNAGMGYDATGATVLPSFEVNNSFGADTLSLVGGTSALWYYRTTVGTLSNSAAAIGTQFGNSLNLAALTLGVNGVLTYDLQPAVSAVPLPGSVWMMGAGLVGMGAFMRRRKVAAAAQA